MFPYKKYLVQESDQFSLQHFGFVMDETTVIKEQVEHIPSSFKTEIIVSYLQNRSVNAEWALSNPELTALLKSETLPTRNIELLFEACKDNPVFREQMEGFLKEEFSK